MWKIMVETEINMYLLCCYNDANVIGLMPNLHEAGV